MKHPDHLILRSARGDDKVSCRVLPQALARWNPSIHAAASEDDTTINILDVIGEDVWTGEGTTAKRINGALRGAKGKDVVVNINSPGGDMFEGLTIYNMLRDYKGSVTVKVLGVAASAASIIAMAGDKVQIARSGFLMIHNAMVFAAGNKEDLRAAADTLAPFDDAMADVYAVRTGMDKDKIVSMMDKETWIKSDSAIADSFADELLPADQVAQDHEEDATATAAMRRMDILLSQSGLSRAERRSMIQALRDKPSAVPQHDTPRAVEVLQSLSFNFDFPH